MHAIMGEVDKVSGSVAVNGKLAYAAQSSFVMNMTLRCATPSVAPSTASLPALQPAKHPGYLTASCCALGTCLPNRDNVLFGSDYDAERYKTVLDACALTSDLDQLPAGDMTQIGERGAFR